jgi:hypothetical protein
MTLVSDVDALTRIARAQDDPRVAVPAVEAGRTDPAEDGC